MAVSQSSEILRRPQRMLYVAFPIVGLVSLVIGFIGLHRLEPATSPFTVLYHDLQLFVLGSDPLQDPPRPQLPMLLAIARFTAPAVTIYTVVEAARLLLSVEMSRRRARRSRGHVVVCGDGAFADALTRRLHEDGVTVVEIRQEADEYVVPGEPLRVLGDARDPEVLRDAGIGRARTVYACAAQGATNLAVALAVGRVREGGAEPVRMHCLVEDSEFCATVQAFFLGRPQPGGVRLDFFDIDQIAARRLLSGQGFPFPAGVDRLMIAGDDGLAAALIVEAARRWRSLGTAGRPTITVIGPGGTRLARFLSGRYSFIDQVCRLEALDGDLLELLLDNRPPEPPDRLLITFPAEEHALRTAMTAERCWPGRTGLVSVRLDGALIGVRRAEDHHLEMAPSSLHVFSAVAAAADPALIQDDLLERLARVLHDRYLRGRRLREVPGERHVPAPAGARALVGWDDLTTDLQQANRNQAEDIGRKLATIGYVVRPRRNGQQQVVLPDADVHALAVLEHDRWCTEQRDAGWRYAASLDESRKEHPGLLPWEELPETMRARNVDPVRDLPEILGEAGFHIVRALPVPSGPAGR